MLLKSHVETDAMATESSTQIVRTTRVATWALLPALAALANVAPVTARAILVVLIASIGVGHGANDDAILERLVPDLPGGRRAISGCYGTLFFTIFALGMRFPRTAERALAALSVWHFGNGDAALARACGSPRRSFRDALVRGLIPIAISSDPARRTLVWPAFACAVAHLAKRAPTDALDLALPAATLALAPAPYGFATYFGAWHAPRHLAVVLQRDARGGRAHERLARFARESARNVAISGVIGAIAYAALRERDPHEIFVALTLGITVPHEAAVWYAERRSGR